MYLKTSWLIVAVAICGVSLSCAGFQLSSSSITSKPVRIHHQSVHISSAQYPVQHLFTSRPLFALEQTWQAASADNDGTSNTSNTTTIATDSNPLLWNRNLMFRWITGLSLGAVATLWIASGNGPFTLGFLLASLIAQNEYYAMVRATGVEPAYKTGSIASLMCYITAAMFPSFHELVMPISATMLMIWLLIFNKKYASINEISTSLLGMFYLGYLPSFWVRLRALDSLLSPVAIMRHNIIPGSFDASNWTFGALVTWWTWLSIVGADVSAYFIGKKFGKHKLAAVSSAAGSASPKKTIEGAVGGIIVCSLISSLGAFMMQWPLWQVTGAAYGCATGFIALVGDLTASMMKRDAKLKDSGNILPGHGGLLDRIDSYMFTAPIAYFFCSRLLPLAFQISRRSGVLR